MNLWFHFFYTLQQMDKDNCLYTHYVHTKINKKLDCLTLLVFIGVLVIKTNNYPMTNV